MDVPALTKEQAIVLTGFTGCVCCVDILSFFEDVEKRMGRPVWTHEYAHNKEEVKELYREDFMKLVGA